MPKVYGSYKTGADIYKDPKTKRFYIIEWNPATRKIYKKFVAFKPTPIAKTIKLSAQTTSKTMKFDNVIRRKQKGGQPGVPGSMPLNECQPQVLNTQSYQSILDELGKSGPQFVVMDIPIIRKKYSENFARQRLVDVIYEHPESGSGLVLGQYNKCWNHGIGNPGSITGGLPGIHVYVAEKPQGGWQLVGIFKKF